MSNPFSESIPFRPGGPTKLLDYMNIEPDESGVILLEEKALRILRDIEEPIAVIAVGRSLHHCYSFSRNSMLHLIKDCLRSWFLSKRKILFCKYITRTS